MPTKPLRILMVTPRYLPDMGGIETHVDEVGRRLVKSGNFEVTVLATDRTHKRPRHETIDGVTVLRVPAWPSDRDYYFAPDIAKVVGQRGRWDIIHCQGIHTPVPMLAMLAAKRAAAPYIVTFHTGGHTLRHRNALRAIQWRIVGPMLRRASSLVAVSRFEADTLSAQARLGDKPIIVIRNGGTLPPPPAGTRAIPGRIVSCGRLERYKGHHRVIEAMPEVIRSNPNAHLIIIGRGPYETELRLSAQRHGVADRVTIKELPPSDRKAMATALAEANVVAAMSDYEAHPVAVMEALSVGRPVVGYDIAGIGELIAEGVVRGVAPGALPSTVAEQLLKAMSAPASSTIPRLPTWDTAAEELGRVYLSTEDPQTGLRDKT
jgi:glycosyltransferase involved in cell wall biosynthesis